MNQSSLSTTIKKLRRFAKDRDWEQFHSPKNLVMALSAEVGELVEIFQWLTEKQSASLSSSQKAKVKEELADVVIYCIRLSDVVGVDIMKIVDEKIAINNKKYPVAKSKGNARKYNELEP